MWVMPGIGGQKSQENTYYSRSRLWSLRCGAFHLPQIQGLQMSLVRVSMTYGCQKNSWWVGTFWPFQIDLELPSLPKTRCQGESRANGQTLSNAQKSTSLSKCMRKRGPYGFTHGDLSSLSILARGDEVVAIVDWEIAGWCPSY